MRRNFFGTAVLACAAVSPTVRAAEPVPLTGVDRAVTELHHLTGHEGAVLDATFLPDGGLLTAGADGSLRLWNVDTGAQVQLVAQQPAAITRLMLSPDRRRALSFSANGAVSVWQLPRELRAWGPEQATGPPNSESGDQRTAWASGTQDGQVEWLLLEYAQAASPRAVRIHENFNPGAVIKVLAVDDAWEESVLWEASPNGTAPRHVDGALEIPVESAAAIRRIKLTIDSPGVPGWNEIDAVGLVDADGAVHWATAAAASSTYGDRDDRRLRDEAPRTPPPTYQLPADAVHVGTVDDTAEGKQSYGGSGHAIMFERPPDGRRLVAIKVFGSRYGMPQPPDEDFHVYLLDGDRRVIRDLAFPYAMFERGAERWVTLGVDGVELPERFGVGLFFNAHQTKGVYVGKDKSPTESHSWVGTPDQGYEPVDGSFDWMVRAYFARDAGSDDSEAR